MFCGLALTAATLYQMVGFTTDTSTQTIVVTGIIQGAGLGLVFVPLTTVAFATLPGELRNSGTAMLTLVRNIGSSIGISMVIANLTSTTTLMHARLAEHINAVQQRPAAGRIDAEHGDRPGPRLARRDADAAGDGDRL